MAFEVDIFNPQESVISHSLEGKVLMLYGGNNLGKTYQAVRLKKPYLMACESGLNGQSGVKYNRINNWRDFKKVVKQFTDKKTVEKAKELYSTIIIDEVYASSIFCQDYVIATYGKGALTLGDTQKGEANLYQLYEKEYFRQINLLVNSGYTVVFIAHEDTRKEKVVPKGDKRCLNPIIDNCDYVIYLQSNGVDENKQVIKSSAWLAETDEFFARSRFTYTPTYIKEFTAENLEAAIIEGIEKEVKETGIETVSFEEQKQLNESKTYDYDELMEAIMETGNKLAEAGYVDELIEIVEGTLGAGKKVSDCTKKQIEAMSVIFDDIKDKMVELGVE